MSTANSNTLAPAGTVMWWDGGERAITAPEKYRIEEHSPSCFTIPLAAPVDVDNLLADCVPGGSITDPQVVADNIRAWFAKPAELAEQPPVGALGTSNGARCYIAHFFAREMRRHDFTTYIATDLAADFACALAQHLAAPGKQHASELHPDDAAVDAFAGALKKKMADARAKGRGGWEDPAQCSAEDLARMLRDHVEKGDPRDVANFCMMLHQRGEAIAAQVGEVQGDARAQFESWHCEKFKTRWQTGAPTRDMHNGVYAEKYGPAEQQVRWEAWQAAWQAALAARQPGTNEPADDDWHLRGYAYASKQETTCAGCGKHKHTPLRIDAMGGYVCLTCIDQKIGAMLGEFGYPPARGIDLGPRPMNTAPRDGTMIRLLVQFTEHATEDTAGPAWTIGARNDHNVGELEWGGWQFAGWCWTHDHFTEGKGTPVGWLPLIDGQRDAAPGVAP